MKFDQIDESIDSIVAIVAKVPQEFKQRTFDALLTMALAEVRSSASAITEEKGDDRSDDDGAESNISEHNSGKAKGRYHQFLTSKGVTEVEVRKVVELDGTAVAFYRSPDANTKAGMQIEWALLLALVSGLESGNLMVSSDAVRKKVQDERIYDQANFAKTFTTHKAYFMGTMNSNDPVRRLSSDGEDALAKLIKKLAA